MSKRILSYLLGAAMCISILSGCGGQQTNGGEVTKALFPRRQEENEEGGKKKMGGKLLTWCWDTSDTTKICMRGVHKGYRN